MLQSDDFKTKVDEISSVFSDCPDLIKRLVILNSQKKGYFFYFQGLGNTELIQNDFINSILKLDKITRENIENSIPTAKIKFLNNINDIIKEISSGYTIFIGEDLNFSVACEFRGYDKRSISEPEVEKNVRGSHEGFIEDLNTNVSILRRRIKNPNLKFKNFTIGTTTNQTVSICYIKDIANEKLLQELSKKIKKLNFDGFIGVGYIEQFISDFPYSIFPQYQTTERPDKGTAALLEGRFLILLDGTPVVLIVPTTFYAFFQAVDDYNAHWIAGTFLMMLRMLSLFITLLLPAIYIALLSFHYYMLPFTLLIPLAESRSRVPFPPVVEALLMEIIIEMIRESAIRLPTYIGATIGVVGGLVIGQAAVQAGIVSTLMIIIVAVTAIAGFTIPNYDFGISIRMMRFAFMIFAAIFGMVGIAVLLTLFFSHLLILTSLGQPYFQPIAPLKIKDLKDVNMRLPLKFLKRRPDIAKPKDKVRGKKNE